MVEEKEEDTEELEEEMEEELEESVEEEVEEEDEEEEDDQELDDTEIDAVPTIICSDDSVMMEIDDTEIREIEERSFLFSTSTENHMNLKYVCPECGRYYYYDMEKKRQGCFIATAAYGTPFSKEINVLRRFRDSYLVHKEWGQEIVNAYYTISPPIANIIEKSDNLRKIVRTCLKPIIELFKEKDP